MKRDRRDEARYSNTMLERGMTCVVQTDGETLMQRWISGQGGHSLSRDDGL